MRGKWLVATGVAVIVAMSGAMAPAGAATSRKVVEAGKIRQRDLPSGWLEKAPDDDDATNVDALVGGIPSCAGVKRLVKDQSKKKAESPEFEKDDDEISNSVNAYKNVAAAKAVMRTARSRNLRTCFAELFEQGLAKAAAEDPDSPVKINDVDTSSGPIAVQAYGDQSSGIAFKVGLDVGFQVELSFSLVFVRVGRYVSAYSLEQEQADPSLPALDQAIRSSVDRMIAAGA
jgi:hypothetical protein